MKKIKQMLALALTLTLVFSLAAMPVEAETITVNDLKIYQTEHTYYTDGYNHTPEDYKYYDKTKNQILSISHMLPGDVLQSESDWEYMFRDLCKLTSMNPLEPVGLSMIDEFMIGTAETFSNNDLKTAVVAHKKTQDYINSVIDCIKSLLSQYSGNINKLKYVASSRNSNPLVKKMQQNSIYLPAYNTTLDKIKGLTFCVDSWWGNAIKVKSYRCNGNSYSGTLTFLFYDHFGLDTNDVVKNGIAAGIRDWYILQHFKGVQNIHKPFLTLVKIHVNFNGSF